MIKEANFNFVLKTFNAFYKTGALRQGTKYRIWIKSKNITPPLDGTSFELRGFCENLDA